MSADRNLVDVLAVDNPNQGWRAANHLVVSLLNDGPARHVIEVDGRQRIIVVTASEVEQ